MTKGEMIFAAVNYAKEQLDVSGISIATFGQHNDERDESMSYKQQSDLLSEILADFASPRHLPTIAFLVSTPNGCRDSAKALIVLDSEETELITRLSRKSDIAIQELLAVYTEGINDKVLTWVTSFDTDQEKLAFVEQMF